MTAGDESSQRDPLDLLSEQFLQQYRGGEPVTIDSFCERHPEHAAALRDLLETLVALEHVKNERISSGSGGRVALPKLERLGDFRIEGELGRGGMGVVFEAVQESLGRRVALKVMPQASLLTGNQLERFRREAQIAARLHHTNIVPVYGSGESDGYHWYAMQFIAGQSLDQWRRQQAKHAPSGSGAWRSRARFVARIGAAAAGALHAAHGYGTLHRDIKPANFLLDADDHVWVTDFGLAKALESEGLTQSGDLLGTLQYMAPEQFAGHYDVRSEVYALGVTLYELLTLEPAFRGRNRSELMEHVKSQRLEAAAPDPDVPQDLLVIIGKAMAREPNDRYRDAHELELDLEAFLEDRPIGARKLSALATLWRWCRRNRAVAGLSAAAMLAVLLLLATGVLSYVAINREHDRAETNLRLSLAAFGDVFDALVGRDALLAYEDDPDTGEQAVVVQAPVSPRDVVLLQKMLAFYDQFASENADSQSLRYDTARAYRRVGAIHARLGEPDSLAQAEHAFEQSLQRLSGITDRDVQRDLARVHVDLGQLYERMRRRDASREHLQQALAIYEQSPLADSPAVRLDRAKVLFELARRRWPPTRPSADDDDDLQRALALVQGLLEDDGDNPEVRMLKARCLREGVRGQDRAERRESYEEAVAILRELVAQHPDRPEFRFELCETIMGGRRSGPLRGGRRSPRGERDEDALHRAERMQRSVELLREADAAAASLLEEQPLFREYRALFGRTRTRLGRELQALANEQEGDDRRASLEEAEVALRTALAAQQELLHDGARADLRYLRELLETRASLGHLLLAQRRADEARVEASAALDQLEQQLARWQARADGADEAVDVGPPDGQPDGPPDGRRDDRAERPFGRGRREGERDGRRERGGRRFRRVGMFAPALPELVRRLEDAQLEQRLDELDARITRPR